jgi:hypothetical protein
MSKLLPGKSLAKVLGVLVQRQFPGSLLLHGSFRFLCIPEKYSFLLMPFPHYIFPIISLFPLPVLLYLLYYSSKIIYTAVFTFIIKNIQGELYGTF